MKGGGGRNVVIIPLRGRFYREMTGNDLRNNEEEEWRKRKCRIDIDSLSGKILSSLRGKHAALRHRTSARSK